MDPGEIRSGGPPPDGIPAIDVPRFLRADDVDFVGDDEPVLAIELDGEARAYPVQVMIWHEIVNDTIAGRPVSVTYCPLCNSAVAVDRRLDDRVLSFGTSGSLYQSALVMYDRQTESLWSHFTGQAVAGVLAGAQLDTIPLATVAWQDWRAAHPDGLVLSRDTGHDRDYGRNPYPGYDDVDEPPFLFDGEIDDRLAAKTRVVGLGLDTTPTAVRLDPLLAEGVVAFELDGVPIGGLGSPGHDLGVGGHRRAVAGVMSEPPGCSRPSSTGGSSRSSRTDDGFRDDQTGSTWNVLGTATAGPLAGRSLIAIGHVDTFWFVWAAFAPDTVVLP